LFYYQKRLHRVQDRRDDLCLALRDYEHSERRNRVSLVPYNVLCDDDEFEELCEHIRKEEALGPCTLVTEENVRELAQKANIKLLQARDDYVRYVDEIQTALEELEEMLDTAVPAAEKDIVEMCSEERS
jgi:glycerol dehydrogenase-like iron-containing ADH family enzyme